ncbi:hypothetical protein OHD16_21800 [Sphingobacterium sp. ML3W]|uniref:hypothetical protein n=1 Tax=Sphingobacterium sp. ML3W TaxID=1538644 RepID=UPI00249CD525|nr:hypothetical protein [Sphingobacterium sp. ML3W]WFA77363.1 hypothetical protein OGI71_14940 [Sphingobacterium sp. ML3W]
MSLALEYDLARERREVSSDDLASLSYGAFRGQKAPVIIRARGYRLESVWHSGSPMSVIVKKMLKISLE